MHSLLRVYRWIEVLLTPASFSRTKSVGFACEGFAVSYGDYLFNGFEAAYGFG